MEQELIGEAIGLFIETISLEVYKHERIESYFDEAS